MGFGSFLSKAFTKVKSIASSVAKTIQKGGKSILKTAIPIAQSVYKEAKSAVTTVYNDSKGFADKSLQMLSHNVDSVTNMGAKIGNPFALPLSLAVGAVGIAYVLTK